MTSGIDIGAEQGAAAVGGDFPTSTSPMFDGRDLGELTESPVGVGWSDAVSLGKGAAVGGGIGVAHNAASRKMSYDLAKSLPNTANAANLPVHAPSPNPASAMPADATKAQPSRLSRAASWGKNAVGRTRAGSVVGRVAGSAVGRAVGGRAVAMLAGSLVPGPGWGIALGIGLTFLLDSDLRRFVTGWMRPGSIDVNEPPSPPETVWLPKAGDNRQDEIGPVDASIADLNNTITNMDPGDHRLWHNTETEVPALPNMTETISQLESLSNRVTELAAEAASIYDGEAISTIMPDAASGLSPTIESMASFSDQAGLPMATAMVNAAASTDEAYQYIREANGESRQGIAQSQGKWFGIGGASGVGGLTDNSDKIASHTAMLQADQQRIVESIGAWQVPSRTGINKGGEYATPQRDDTGNDRTPPNVGGSPLPGGPGPSITPVSTTPTDTSPPVDITPPVDTTPPVDDGPAPFEMPKFDDLFTQPDVPPMPQSDPLAGMGTDPFSDKTGMMPEFFPGGGGGFGGGSGPEPYEPPVTESDDPADVLDDAVDEIDDPEAGAGDLADIDEDADDGDVTDSEDGDEEPGDYFSELDDLYGETDAAQEEADLEARTVEIGDREVEFPTEQAADMARDMLDSDGKALRDIAADNGFNVPPQGEDIGQVVQPVNLEPGHVVSAADGVDYLFIGDGEVVGPGGEVLPLEEVAVFEGEHQGLFALDPGEGGDAPEPTLGTEEVEGADDLPLGDEDGDGPSFDPVSDDADQGPTGTDGIGDRRDDAPVGMGAGQNVNPDGGPLTDAGVGDEMATGGASEPGQEAAGTRTTTGSFVEDVSPDQVAEMGTDDAAADDTVAAAEAADAATGGEDDLPLEVSEDGEVLTDSGGDDVLDTGSGTEQSGSPNLPDEGDFAPTDTGGVLGGVTTQDENIDPNMIVPE